MPDTTDPQTDRPRALHLLEAADFLRNAHFRDGLSVQEAITALRHMADEADPMVGSLARDGFGLDEIAAMPVAPVAAPPTGQAGLRELVAAALYRHEWPGKQVWEQALAMDREAFLAQADAVLTMLFGPIPADMDTATWTAIRAIQLMNEAGQQRDATSESHRLALSTALGLGTGAPWDAIRERAAELADEERDEYQAQTTLDQLAEDLAAAIASCPGRELDPNPCRCPCYGCKHHCGAHDLSRLAEDATPVAACLNCRGSGLDPRYNGEYACPDCPGRVADEEQQVETQAADAPPVCEGFRWIGQSFATCDRCGQPAWDHEGEEVAVEGAGPFDSRRTVRPWKPGEADAIRAKWGTPTPPSAVAEPGKENGRG